MTISSESSWVNFRQRHAMNKKATQVVHIFDFINEQIFSIYIFFVPRLTSHAKHIMFSYIEPSCHARKYFSFNVMTWKFSIYVQCMTCMFSIITFGIFGIVSVNPPTDLIPPVRRSSEIIKEIIITTNQIAKFCNSHSNWNSSLILLRNWKFALTVRRGLTKKIRFQSNCVYF